MIFVTSVHYSRWKYPRCYMHLWWQLFPSVVTQTFQYHTVLTELVRQDKTFEKEELRAQIQQPSRVCCRACILRALVLGFEDYYFEDYWGHDTHLEVVLAKPRGSRRGEAGGEGEESGAMSLKIEYLCICQHKILVNPGLYKYNLQMNLISGGRFRSLGPLSWQDWFTGFEAFWWCSQSID